MEQYETISKFDRQNAGLQGGNNLQTKPATIETVNAINGEAETFIVQTIRGEEQRRQKDGKSKVQMGNYIIIKYVDKEGTKRLILPPRVAETIERQGSSLTDKARSNAAKAQAHERKLRGEVPGFMRNRKKA